VDPAVGLAVILGVAAVIAVVVAVRRDRDLGRARATIERLRRDDTDRAKLAADRAAEDAAFRDALDSGLLRVDPTLRIGEANARAHVLLGRAAGGLVGRSLIEAFIDPGVEALARTAIETGSATGETRSAGPDGPALIVRARRVANDGAWLVLDDVSELRRLQRIRAEFIDNLSHELRTPITTILAGSRLLRRQIGDGPVATDVTGDLAADIEAEADRLFRIVEDLLVLSRLERRNLLIAQEPVHVAHLVERVVASEARRWPTHRFVTPERVNVGVVRGEETYIEQVLRNLLANAAKYSPSGSTVEVHVDDDPDGVAVRVLDDGPGIARAEVEQLFTLFYRSPATAATAAGAGIGLFVSRQLVDAMGGRMWAQRRRRGGSEFGFSLVAYPIDEDEPFLVADGTEETDGKEGRSDGELSATPGRTQR
jgi:two-component system phosphate regulon sensor histidine kinase PhoR